MKFNQLFQDFPRPGCFAQFVHGQQCGLNTQVGKLTHEVLAFFIAGDAQETLRALGDSLAFGISMISRPNLMKTHFNLRCG